MSNEAVFIGAGIIIIIQFARRRVLFIILLVVVFAGESIPVIITRSIFSSFGKSRSTEDGKRVEFQHCMNVHMKE